MKRLIIILTIVLFSVAFLCADVYVKSKTHTGAMEIMGQKTPAKDTISEQWLGEGKFAMISNAQSQIIDLKKKVIYIVNHGSRTYIEASLPLDMSKLMPAMVSQMMNSMKIEVNVKPNGQTKKIREWNSNGYDVEMSISGMMPIKMKMIIWASTDVPFDLNSYRDKLYPAILKTTYARFKFTGNMMEEFKKIAGFQVASEMSMDMMGAKMTVTSNVLEITKKSPPKGVYTVPDGYTKKDKFNMGDMQGK